MTRALFLVSPTQMTAAVIDGWLRAGNSVAGIWCDADSPLLRASSSVSGLLFPRFDCARLLRRHRIRAHAFPDLTNRTDLLKEARALRPDVILSAMFMRRIPTMLLEAFPGRVLNLHPALLPDYRGPAPITGMLADGSADRYDGVTLHLVSDGFDEGPIVAWPACPRSGARDAFEWRLQIAVVASRLVTEDLAAYLRGERDILLQPPGSGSYRRLLREDTELGTHMGLAALRARLRNFGPHHVHRWLDRSGRETAVTGLSAVLGPRADRSDRRGLLGIDVDLADCRVRLRQRTPAFQIARNVARLSALHRATRVIAVAA